MLRIDDTELFYLIALNMVQGVGPKRSKILLEHFGSAENIFKTSARTIEKMLSFSSVLAGRIAHFQAFKQVEEELAFIQKHNIRTYFLFHEDYPKYLKQCADAPILLFGLGDMDLSKADKFVSVVGTRDFTPYGKEMVREIVQKLTAYNIVIVSGLALGIDGMAHQTALDADGKTVAVLAHGLANLYPPQHKNMSLAIQEKGLLLTEFLSKTLPDKDRFPARNRIIAGLSDATIVIETKKKGGSMITASLACSYDREVFAVPGKLTDPKSEGSHFLIQNNQAHIFTSVSDFLKIMNWECTSEKENQKNLRPIPVAYKEIYTLIANAEKIHIDTLLASSEKTSAEIMSELLQLELSDYIQTLPGNYYRIR